MESKPKQPEENPDAVKEPTPLERAEQANAAAQERAEQWREQLRVSDIPLDTKIDRTVEAVVTAAELETLTQYVEQHPGTREAQGIEGVLRSLNKGGKGGKEGVLPARLPDGRPGVLFLNDRKLVDSYLYLAENGLEAYKDMLRNVAEKKGGLPT